MEPSFRKIQFWDGLRSFFSGSIFHVSESLAMLVLIDIFMASAVEKSVFAVLINCGLLAGIPIIVAMAKWKIRLNVAMFLLLLLASVCVLLAAHVTSIAVYIPLIVVALLGHRALAPLNAELYRGYDRASRGKRYVSSALTLAIGVLGFSALGIYLLRDDSARYSIVFYSTSFALFLSSLASLFLPSRAISEGRSIRYREFYQILRSDRLFAYLCVAWFIFGISNLWLLPYRTNVLREPAFGINYAPGTIILLLVVIPEAFRVISIPLSGYLFDKMNLIVFRIGIHFLFICYALLFFLGDNFGLHVAGMVCFGLATGAGSMTWQLWVTRIASPDKVSSYMAIHSALTGIRSILGPAIGYHALSSYGVTFCTWVSIGLMVTAVVMLSLVIKQGKTRFEN